MDWKLIELITERVFPPGWRPTLDAKQLPLDAKFYVIGSSKGLRWIIPQNPKYGVSVLRQWRPYGKLSYLKWLFLLAFYRIGKLSILPKVASIGVTGLSSKGWQHLGFGEGSLIPLIYIGTPGLNRKAVVSLLDKKTCQLIGVAKVPLADRAKSKILQEAKILDRLATEKPGLAPKLLYLDRERGIAVQTSKEGKPTKTELTSAHISWFMRAGIFNQQTSLIEQVHRLEAKLSSLDSVDFQIEAKFNRLLETLKDPAPLHSFWVHGDFAPWNLKLNSDRSLVAVDWEEGCPNGLPLQDLFHYQYIQSHLLGKPVNTLETTKNQPIVAQYLDSLGIDSDRYRQLALFYLVESWISCQERADWGYAAFLLAEISRILGEIE